MLTPDSVPANPSKPDVILIVDDMPANLRVLSDALTQGGFEVAVATTGEHAIRQAQHNPPDLILLDVQMPGIDGFETCRRLKSDPNTHNIPVIFMTALTETERKVTGLSVGAVDYITKPFQQEEVLARVKVHLQISTLNKQLAAQNALFKQFNETLEQRVAKRTAELQKANLQILQQEKLSSLGQLVAGVAHEINNPINFIYGNIDPACRYIEDLLEIVQIYQEDNSTLSPKVQQKISISELDFLRKDLPKIMDSMRIGAERIREIVLSLRNFSRLDEADFKRVNIHEGIDNTLLIINHRLKNTSKNSGIQIIKKYAELPLIDCYPGQLNQVFMNIISNAIDAIEEHNEMNDDSPSRPHTIQIRTEELSNDWVAIRIIDNGPGIPDNMRHKIFDPFFTTKPVGRGTGLGLSISHQIVVETHKGSILCHSVPGEGTEFVIEVPVYQHVAELPVFLSVNEPMGSERPVHFQ